MRATDIDDFRRFREVAGTRDLSGDHGREVPHRAGECYAVLWMRLVPLEDLLAQSLRRGTLAGHHRLGHASPAEPVRLVGLGYGEVAEGTRHVGAQSLADRRQSERVRPFFDEQT
jgi:hypothetical protein